MDSALGTAQATTITIGQMYVRYQIPVEAKPTPVVLIPGCCLSGQTYETTPDNRMGWDEHFLRAGRSVYIVDPIGRGRSGFDAGTQVAAKSPITTMSHELAWLYFRIGPKPGIPFPDTQFPVEALDAFHRMWIPDLNATLPQPNPTWAALAELGKTLRGAVLIGHSQSFMFPARAALIDPAAVKAIISLESGSACEAKFTPSQYATLAKIPMLIVFADHLNDASKPFDAQWAKSLSLCRRFASEVQAMGGDVTFWQLPELGIRGNTHMFMLEKNNRQIADLLLDWISTHVEHAPGVRPPLQ